MSKKRGPLPSPYQPSREKYKCPVKDCDCEFRGDDISKHFQKYANLAALDKANENQSTVLCEKAGDIIKLSENSLNNLLIQASESVKNHTLYLLHNEHSSKKLPTYNSANFKSQLKTSLPDAFKNFGFTINKKPKLAQQTERSEENSNSVDENVNEETESLVIISENPTKSFSENNENFEIGRNHEENNENSENKSENNSENSENNETAENNSENNSENSENTNNTDDKNIENAEEIEKNDIVKVSNLASPEFIELLAEKIAQKVIEANQKKTVQDDDDDFNKFWIESDNYWVCNPCLFNSKRTDIPKQLISKKVGNFGYVVKNRDKSTSIDSKSNINMAKKRHCESALHHWCVEEFKKKSQENESSQRKNEIVAKKVIRNALFCFKRSGGAEDFLALNAKDFLAEKDVGSFNIATKNDSTTEFFRLRNVIFDIMTEKTKQFFSSNVQDIAVTLDKVTVNRTSFTVIMTYFFNEGMIHVVLNKLQKLSTSDYDAPGTANMVIETLCETLGFSKSKLSRILKHFIYDGVYADKEERVEGGGCLELKKHVAEALGLDDDSITGN